MHRVEDLSDREEGFIPEDKIPFYSLVPLAEIIAEAKGVGKKTVAVENEYRKLVQSLGDEFNILLDASREELAKLTSGKIADGILRMRERKIDIRPGYDGAYGEVKLFSGEQNRETEKQLDLF